MVQKRDARVKSGMGQRKPGNEWIRRVRLFKEWERD
jgi:hypothetical protein